MIEKITKSPEETKELGRSLAEHLKPGSIVALCGEFGAGKTVFVKGIAEGLGVEDVLHAVISPSFTLVKEYEGRMPLYHFDLYRITSEEDLFTVGYEEYFEKDGAIVIEWADKFMHLFPKDIIRVDFKVTGEQEREIRIRLPL